MPEILEGDVKQWGGSLALRLRPEDARRLGLKPGMHIRYSLVDAKVDLGEPPTFRDDPDASARHDEHLYGG